MNSQIIIHVPHASTHIPKVTREKILLTDDQLIEEHRIMIDWYMDELATACEKFSTSIIYPFSRLVADPERFTNDADEPMATKGMGVVYTKTAHGNILRDFDQEYRDRLIRKYYDPHHKKFEALVNEILLKDSKCLIIDLHSYPSIPYPFELKPDTDRPDICIGVDDFHTPEKLIGFTEDTCHKFGYSTAINIPFAGSIVPMKFFNQDDRVKSIMIEIKRPVYMDETTCEKTEGFGVLTDYFCNYVQNIVEML
jgi:N-formylglutamate deformylase